MSNQRTEKKGRMSAILRFFIEKKKLPKGSEIDDIAEEYGVSSSTIRDDIRKVRVNNLFVKASELLDEKLSDDTEWKHSDLINLLKVTTPKQIESKINLRAQIDIKGESVADILREYGGIREREHIHRERANEDKTIY